MLNNITPYKFTSKCFLLIAGMLLSVVLVYASTGGGKDKKSTTTTSRLTVSTKVLVPFRAVDLNFSQKNSKDFKYVGNLKFAQSTTIAMNSANQPTSITQNSILKYKVGNTIYLVPNKTTYNVPTKNNLTAIDVKIAF